MKLDLQGKISGFLKVLSEAGRDPHKGYVLWLCQCVCGKQCVVRSVALDRGLTKSCGCKTGEMVSQATRTHGKSKSPEYKAWLSMRKRCADKENHRYGGRGIRVCLRWERSFPLFFSDMGSRPSKLHSLERENNSKDYKPSNCRWATQQEQANNRRSSFRITLDGVTLTLAEWSRKTGIKAATISMRLMNRWGVRDALQTPVHVRRCA